MPLVLCILTLWGSFGDTGGGWFRWQCSPFSQPHLSPPPSPLCAGLGVLVLVPNLGSLQFLYWRSCSSHELLVGLWGDGLAPGWSLDPLASQRY